MKRFLFINSHPIQYYSPLYSDLSKVKDVEVEVFYLSDESVRGALDKEFGVNVKWDVPVLDGYKYRFIPNRSLKPSIHNGFWGLFNPGLIFDLFRRKKSVVVILGWASVSCVLAIIFSKIAGHTVCMRGDNPFNQELQKGRVKRFVKNFFLKFLFIWIDYFLYVGHQNKLFYQSFGVKSNRLIFAPHAVNNEYFTAEYEKINPLVARKRLGISDDKKVILFVGKYIDKKRPLDLLKMMQRLKKKNYKLIMVGEGELRNTMESFITTHSLGENVILTGFINQGVISTYYRCADVFVMCSGAGETWGLAVNEAMNFCLPVIVADIVGCADDLVENGRNGYKFVTGNVEDMASKVEMILEDECNTSEMGKNSHSIIQRYANIKIIDGLLSIN